MQINIADVWPEPTRTAHRDYIEQLLGNSLPARSGLMNTFINQFGSILALGTPEELRRIIARMTQLEALRPQEKADFHADCERLLDYDRFSRKNSRKGPRPWNAYNLCSSSKYRLCPYCQQAMATTIHRVSSARSIRPTLDHFYSQSKYPYLSLSLYNLVPSCYACNSSLKGSIDFYRRPHLHPFEDSESIRYQWNIQDYIDKREKGELAPATGIAVRADLRPEIKYKVGRSMRTFLVKARLAVSEPEIARFVEVLVDYSRGRIDEVNAGIGRHHWRISEASALQFSYNNYKNEWLGRLKRDLYETSPLRTMAPPTLGTPDPVA